ncbi:MAG: hypothetical protein EOO38_31440 [Cytophagaceae bacterium]|nr:MAG: hypothetical protein EOO38_31440 [Cytophagaceae bacterium]
MGVILHEMCHVLYDEQPAEIQHEIQKWFDENPSSFAPAAYTFFDEAMATALGNGYAYKELKGQMDSTEWYNNPYINGFAKALYPVAEQYLNSGKPIDKAFIDAAIAIFEKTFPDSLTDYMRYIRHPFQATPPSNQHHYIEITTNMGLDTAIVWSIGLTGVLFAYYYLASAYSYNAETCHGRNANLYHDRDGTYDPDN